MLVNKDSDDDRPSVRRVPPRRTESLSPAAHVVPASSDPASSSDDAVTMPTASAAAAVGGDSEMRSQSCGAAAVQR